MATNEEIQSFAKKWIEIYNNNKNTVSALASDDLCTECETLGFEMDCGKSLEAAFPGIDAFNDYLELERIIDKIEDTHLIGCAIFSKWRYYVRRYSKNIYTIRKRRRWLC